MAEETDPFDKPLGNRYFALRHAHSLANQQGIVLSDPDAGCQGFGLSEQGRASLVARVGELREQLERPRIFSSDFLRTRQTAEILADECDCRVSPPQRHVPPRCRG